jgi:hypothetical protein
MKRLITAVNVRLLRVPCWEYVVAWLTTVSTHGDHLGHPWF